MHLWLITLIVPVLANATALDSELKCLEKSEPVAIHGKESGEITVDVSHHRAAVANGGGAVYVFTGQKTYVCDKFATELKKALFLKAKIGSEEIALIYFGRNFKRPNRFSDTYPRVEFTTLSTISAMAKNENDLLHDKDGYVRAFDTAEASCRVDRSSAPTEQLTAAMRTRIDALGDGYQSRGHDGSDLIRTRVLAALDSCSSVPHLRALVAKKKTEIQSENP